MTNINRPDFTCTTPRRRCSSSSADVVAQPDSGKVGAFERRPEGGGFSFWFHRDDRREYIDGEQAPKS
jgi:hypothetical protein